MNCECNQTVTAESSIRCVAGDKCKTQLLDAVFKANKEMESKSNSSAASVSSFSMRPEKQGEQKVEQSYALAEEANTEISAKNYAVAVNLLTSAIELNANDYRFFVNRSFCYECLKSYFSALKDAKRAIALNANKSKCYFRRGRALLGLGMFDEAESSFKKVLELEDGYNRTAEMQLLQVRIQCLTSLGVNEKAVTYLASKYKCLADIYANKEILNTEITDFTVEERSHTRSALNITNPFAWKALYVTNVSLDVKQDTIIDLFSKFGDIIRCVHLQRPDGNSFFIHYNNSESPRRAMAEFQGAIVKGVNNDREPLRIWFRPSDEQKQEKFQKKLGGKECYYWRTTGCYNSNCKRVHIPGNEGVDLQPWMKAHAGQEPKA